MSNAAYKRVLLKLSGESFCRDRQGGISMPEVGNVAQQIKNIVDKGVQVAIVSGGGNILRGGDFSSASSMVEPAQAHYMGMLATVINAMALQSALEHLGLDCRVQTAIRMESVAEPFIRRRCIRHLEKNRVVILAAGTGSPFVTTDTAAALRAREINADVILKATKVDGVYSDDPAKNPHALRYSEISFDDVLAQKLKVMDAHAIAHCQESRIPILVFNFRKEGNIELAVMGQKIGTIVRHMD